MEQDRQIMDDFEREFNQLLVDTFHLILKEEMYFVKSLTKYDVSAREIHLIENVGLKDGLATISDISEALQITMASITVMVNKLEAQGYVTKRRDESDARTVRLALTDKGKEIDARHTEFHSNMVREIIGELNDSEKAMLSVGVKKLNDFFQKNLKAL